MIKAPPTAEPSTGHAGAKRRILCFGEVLWDLLPDGPHLGGAPLNVAWHIARHSMPAAMVSAVGNDKLGRNAKSLISSGGVEVTLLHALDNRATGTVEVRLDDHGDASYHFPPDVAWDHIPFDVCLAHAAATASALVYGSLAMRKQANRETLHNILRQLPDDALVVMDVNLRPPFQDRAAILDLARYAQVLKLNLAELEFLLGRAVATDPTSAAAPLKALHELTGCTACCLTLGTDGALWWTIDAPETPLHHPGHAGLHPLVNTIGAGDSFLAALVCSLLREGGINEHALDHAGRVAAYVTSCASATPDYDPKRLPKPQA